MLPPACKAVTRSIFLIAGQVRPIEPCEYAVAAVRFTLDQGDPVVANFSSAMSSFHIELSSTTLS
jgi:hypothetical protein